MPEFKSISRDAVPLALAKVERYRLLNEPAQAESVCLDILAVDPHNEDALVMLLLSLTDQFSSGSPRCFDEALAVVPRLAEEYHRLYYSGIIGAAVRPVPSRVGPEYGSRVRLHRRAMEYYEQAEALRPPANDDPILRWNGCLRLCQRYQLHAGREEVYEPVTGD